MASAAAETRCTSVLKNDLRLRVCHHISCNLKHCQLCTRPVQLCMRRGCLCLGRRAASAAARSVAGAATRSVTSATPQASPTTGEPAQQQTPSNISTLSMQLCCVAWCCTPDTDSQSTESAACIWCAALSHKLACLTVHTSVLHCPVCGAISLLQSHC